jgi:hypothetical protein
MRRYVITAVGVAIVALFFAPWFGAASNHSMTFATSGQSGWGFATSTGWQEMPGARWLLLIPIVGTLLAAASGERVPSRLGALACSVLVFTVTLWAMYSPLRALNVESGESAYGTGTAIAGGMLAVAGSFLDRRGLRALGALIIASSMVLTWSYRAGTGIDLLCSAGFCHPASILPWLVLAGAILALISAIMPRRHARYVAWTGAVVVCAAIGAFAVTTSTIGVGAWATLAVAAVGVVASLARSPQRLASRGDEMQIETRLTAIAADLVVADV